MRNSIKLYVLCQNLSQHVLKVFYEKVNKIVCVMSESVTTWHNKNFASNFGLENHITYISNAAKRYNKCCSAATAPLLQGKVQGE